ncbi:MAG: RadC family protein [Deltaproteobacteria bacterium]|nr:RadC family protein [Deltaproteobacteria bacterium]MBZ0220573.1 DNA repair protein RadC [Deltaproteobacteria bacterium]
MKNILMKLKTNSEDLRNDEILEVIFRLAGTGGDPRAKAESIMKKMGGPLGVFGASFKQLIEIGGIEEKPAFLILAARSIASGLLKEKVAGRDAIRCKKDVLDYLKLRLFGEKVEKFVAIYMNSKNEVLAIETLHEGTVNRTAIYPRKVIERAFLHNARSAVFAHNHPSGNPAPSAEDRHLIRELDRASLAVDLIVHDHLIIGDNRHFSARDNGWILGCAPALPSAAE